MTRWFVQLATLGPLGHMNASGTLASLVTLPLVYWMHTVIKNPLVYLFWTVVAFGVGFFIVHQSLNALRRNDDPSEIVIDEVVGCMLVFCGIPFSARTAIFGFILFRLFDISKIAGIAHAERLGGAAGIMLDDVIAAILSNILLRLIL